MPAIDFHSVTQPRFVVRILFPQPALEFRSGLWRWFMVEGRPQRFADSQDMSGDSQFATKPEEPEPGQHAAQC